MCTRSIGAASKTFKDQIFDTNTHFTVNELLRVFKSKTNTWVKEYISHKVAKTKRRHNLDTSRNYKKQRKKRQYKKINNKSNDGDIKAKNIV